MRWIFFLKYQPIPAAAKDEGVIKVGDISESRDDAELRIIESFEAALGLPKRDKQRPQC